MGRTHYGEVCAFLEDLDRTLGRCGPEVPVHPLHDRPPQESEGTPQEPRESPAPSGPIPRAAGGPGGRTEVLTKELGAKRVE